MYNGSCFEGQAAVDTCNVDLCRQTSMGPLCGKCKLEPRSYMKDERCYHCKGGQTMIVVSVIFFVAIAPTTIAFIVYRFSRVRALALRTYRRVFDIGRFKVVWVTYQIMTTVAWNVQVLWPEPFKTFERLLSVLDMSLLRILPVACMVSRGILRRTVVARAPAMTYCCLQVEFDFISDFYVIVITPLLVAGAIAAAGFVRAAHRPEKRNHFAYLHGSLLLLGTFLVLPATSMKVGERSTCGCIRALVTKFHVVCSQIFRVLRPCFKLKTNNVWLHYADLAVNCESKRFLNAKTLAVVMIFIYPVGIPLGYACLLSHFRHHINPPGCDDQLQAMRARNEAKSTKPELRAIDFLFSCYRPGAWWFEVFDSLRRIVMTGLITYVPKTSGPPIAGVMLSLVSLTVFREVQPYENPSTNALSAFGQWQLLSTYLLAYALLTELSAAPQSKLVFVGTVLLLCNLYTVFAALYLQINEGDRRVELSLTLAEHEMRETELEHEQEQMKAE